MGVPGLWPLLAEAAESHNLESLDLAHLVEQRSSSEANLDPRLPVVGVDLSAWLFHARQSVEGSNPILRLIFFRLLRLLSLPLRAVFVFDGPDRPAKKRGRIIGGRKHPLTGPLTEIIKACGMIAWEARGEAEAELARMTREGLVDAVLSDDVDALVFGSKAVMRNWSATTMNRPHTLGADEGENAVTIYKASNVEELPELCLGPNGLVLIALMAGGDYDARGVGGCGVKMALSLAQGGYGDSLKAGFDEHCKLTGYDPESKMPLVEQRAGWDRFVEEWKEQVRDELSNNRQGFLTSRQPRLASSEAFQSFLSTEESVQILASYIHPITTWSIYETYGQGSSSGVVRAPPRRQTFPEPSLSAIAGFAQRTFAWGPKYTVGRLRNLAWKGMLLRHLRHHSRTAVSDVRDYRRAEESTDGGSEAEQQLQIHMIKIHSERHHAVTGKRLEYRVEWDPTALARVAESGVDPTLNVGAGFDEALDDSEAVGSDDAELVPASPYQVSLAALAANEGGSCPPSPTKRKAKPPPDPYSPVRDWVLADRLAATRHGQALIEEYCSKTAGKKAASTAAAKTKAAKQAQAKQPGIDGVFSSQKATGSLKLPPKEKGLLKLPPKEKGLLKLPPKDKGLLKLPPKEPDARRATSSSAALPSSSEDSAAPSTLPAKRPSTSNTPERLNLPKRTFGRTQSGPATLGSSSPPQPPPPMPAPIAPTQRARPRIGSQATFPARRNSVNLDDDDSDEADCSLPDAMELLRSIADPNRGRGPAESSSCDSSPDVVLSKRQAARARMQASAAKGSSTTFTSRRGGQSNEGNDGFEIVVSAAVTARAKARGARKSDAIILSDSE